jgi:hypothetical protein
VRDDEKCFIDLRTINLIPIPLERRTYPPQNHDVFYTEIRENAIDE